MNFKDKYQQENEEITLDAAFTAKLADQMKKEQRAQRRRKKMLVSMGGVAAAAITCVVVLHGINTSNQSEQQDVQKKAEAVETHNEGHGFGHQAWYGDAETEEEIFEAFRVLLRDEQIETLYCSDIEEYEEEDILSKDEAEKIIKTLQKAEASDGEAEGECKYYMAVFENGSIVKFEIYGEKYLKLKDSESVYSF